MRSQLKKFREDFQDSQDGMGPDFLRNTVRFFYSGPKSFGVPSQTPPLRPVRPLVEGFTLIELMVVIAIIALLAALLLPALARAKALAQRTVCKSDLKQWAVAFTEYVHEHEELIPREGYHFNGLTFLNTWAQVLAVKDRDPWYNALPPYLGHAQAAAYEDPANFPSFYGRQSFFQCPSAKFPKDALYPTCQFAYFSRSMNSQLITPTTVYLYRTATVSWNCILDTAATPLFLDNRLEDEPKASSSTANDNNLGQPSSEATRFSLRHLQGGNIVFADGHVDWFAGKKVVGPDGGRIEPPNPNIVWDLPLPK